MIAVAIFLPWLALMLRGRIFQGIICLILQFTLFGWLPAIIWALLVVMNDNSERRNKELIASLNTNSSKTIRPSGSRDIPTQSPQYDKKKWDALLKYDADIQRAYDEVKKYGPEAVNQLAGDFLAINDKTILPEIVKKICADGPSKLTDETKIRISESNVFRFSDGCIIGLRDPSDIHVFTDSQYYRFDGIIAMEKALPNTKKRSIVSNVDDINSIISHYKDFIVSQIVSS